MANLDQSMLVRARESCVLLLLEALCLSVTEEDPIQEVIPSHPNLLTEEHWANKRLYEHFAAFLAIRYVQPRTGERLSPRTAQEYLHILILIGQSKCRNYHAPGVQDFFSSCCDPRGGENVWYEGIIRAIVRSS